MKKQEFIKHYVDTFGNITKTCNKVGISRTTFYNWMQNDENFKADIEASEPLEQALDFAEHHLMKRIKEGSDTCLIFFLKTKGKHRGYIEKQQIEQVQEPQKRYVLQVMQ